MQKTRIENKRNIIFGIISDLLKGKKVNIKYRFDLLKKYNYYIYINDGTIISAELKDGSYATYDAYEIEKLQNNEIISGKFGLDRIMEQYTTEQIIDKIGIDKIEMYLRNKKIEQIKCKKYSK